MPCWGIAAGVITRSSEHRRRGCNGNEVGRWSEGEEVEFDGEDDYIIILHTDVFNFAEFTVEARVC